MDWAPDYPGDTYVFLGDVPLRLSRPSEFTADVADGRIVSSHLRRLDPPLRPDAAALVVRSYDPGHYFSYTIPANATLTGGSGCASRLRPADPATARAKAKSSMQAFSEAGGLDQNFPRIGEFFADEVRVTCSKEQVRSPDVP